MADRSTRINLENDQEQVINPATEDKQDDTITNQNTIIDNQTNGTQRVKIYANSTDVDTQHPLPTDGDSIYAKDIDTSGSDVGTFTGAITSLFDDLDTTFSSTGHSSPAYFSVKLKRPINNTSIKFCSPVGKNFSNVKITLKDRGGVTVGTVDDSSNNTKYSSNTYDYALTAFCTILVEFYTTDDIDINYALLEKSIDVHSIIRAAKPNGQLVDIGATTGGNLKISLEEFETTFYDTPLPVIDWNTEVAKGNITGHSVVHKYGRNSNMPNGTEAAITDDGALNFLSTASTVRIKAGGNANDISNGSGAREITVQGSNSTGEFISETISTNGASASTSTTNSFLRIYRAFVSSSGTYVTTGLSTAGTNQGDIVVENTAGTVDLIQINQYEGQSQYGGYHIPSDKTGYLNSILMTVSSNKESDIIMYVRDNATDTSVPVEPRKLKLYFDGVVGEAIFKPKIPLLIGSDCDIWFTGKATALGTEVSVDFEILLINN